MFAKPHFVVTALLLSCAAASCGAQYKQPTADAPPETATPIVQSGDRTSGPSQSTVTIAQGGKALVPIVVAAGASDSVQASANYLAEKLEEITGAKFEIQNGDGKSGLVVGTISQFPVESLKKPLEVRRVLKSSEIESGAEAYAIRTEAQRVLLLGGGEAGVSHAVTRLLELLGYRQFYPGEVWEIAPRQSTLTFAYNETDRPTILARVIWYAFGPPAEPYTMETQNWSAGKRAGPAKKDLDDWYRQNRWGESFQVRTAHNWASIVRNHKAEFEAHPEYYTLAPDLKTGVVGRVPRGICPSQPAVRAFAIQDALAYFEKNPGADMFSMERGDGDVSCACELCKAQGSESNRVFGLANEVARAVREKFPGKMIGVLSYNTHDLPPDFGLEANVHVQVARLFIRSKTPFPDLMEQWSKRTSNLGAREYFSTYQWGQDRLRIKTSAGPTANLETLQRDIPMYEKKGVLSVWSESSIAWGAHGRGNYIASKLLWNPQADVNAVLQDFYDKAFGPAAPAMKTYFERADGGNETEPTPAFLLALMNDLQHASTLAKDRPDVLARLDQLKQFLYFNYLQFRVRTEKDKKPWILEQFRHEFRTRFSYMTHWEATRSLMGRNKNIEPSWVLPSWKVFREAGKKGTVVPNPPWLDWTPYSPEETEQKFQEAKKYFESQS